MKNFRLAYEDYRFLRARGFAEKASLALVGDRYRLSRIERNVIFRGVVVEPLASDRSVKLVGAERVTGQALGIDWYNVLITVESYLRGSLLFVADDGVLRDSASAHGSYRRTSATEAALPRIAESIAALAPARVDVFLDSPIAFSALMADELRTVLDGHPFTSCVSLSRSADFPLKSYEGIVATSDSVILDTAGSVFDLARHVLRNAFGFNAPVLPSLGPESPQAPSR